MLQQSSLNRALIDDYEISGDFPPAWSTMAELERVTDALVARLRADRATAAAKRSPLASVRQRLDDLLRTDAVEYLDRSDVSDEDKVREVRAIHAMNVAFLSYQRFERILRPRIRGVARAHGRPARVLELGCGSGEFTLGLARAAARSGLQVEVCGSDIVPAYVERGLAAVRERGLGGVHFRVVNAFDMSALDAGEYDIIFIAQSVHHFSPGQLAMMIAQARRVAAHSFVAIDGQRSLYMFGVLAASGLAAAAYARRHHVLIDGLISARRFYAEAELEAAARIAAPDALVSVRSAFPGFSVLTVS